MDPRNIEGQKQFLRSRMWKESDIILTQKKENVNFEILIRDALENIDFSNFDRERLIVELYEYAKEQEIQERDIALLLLLFERAINVFEAIERERLKTAETIRELLRDERALEGKEEYDHEAVQDLDREVAILCSGSREDIINLLQIYSKEELDNAAKEKSPFAGPYVRTLLDSQNGNRRYTERLKEQLATLLRTSPQAIAAMKAWKSGELHDRGSTVEAIIENMRGKIQHTKDEKSEKEDQEPHEKAPQKDIEEPLSIVYSFISNEEYLEFIHSLQPNNFSLDKNFTREQRRWIYALMLLGPEDEAGKKELRGLVAEKIFCCSKQKVAAVTAYLSGKLYEKAKENQSEIWEDIQRVKDILKPKEGLSPSEAKDKEKPCTSIISLNEVPPTNNPDYDNEAKEKGWREPYRRMVERAWGCNKPLQGKKMLILETSQLLEWQMLEKMGACEADLTIVEREEAEASAMREKLPRANVVHSTLLDFFAAIAASRLKAAGTQKEWEKLGVSPKNPTSYFTGGKHIIYPLGADVLNGLRSEFSESPGFNELAEAPHFAIHNFPNFRIDRKQFDLVSLDTKSMFETMAPEISAIHALGLLSDDNLFFTNFYGQREQSFQQEGYEVGIEALKAEYPFMPTLPGEEDELSDKREVLSHTLISTAELGMGVQGRLFVHNSLSPFVQKVLLGMGKDEKKFLQEVRAAARNRLERYGSIDSMNFFEEWINAKVRSRMRALFSPPRYHDLLGIQVPPEFRDRGISFQDVFAEGMRDIFVDTVARAQYPMDQEKTMYRDRSWMYADFTHFKTGSVYCQVKSKVRRNIAEVFLGHRKPKSIKPRDVSLTLARLTELSFLQNAFFRTSRTVV